jgi:hypothetical protein
MLTCDYVQSPVTSDGTIMFDVSPLGMVEIVTLLSLARAYGHYTST